MENLTGINLTLSQRITQVKEAILSLYKHLLTLQVQMYTNKPETDNMKKEKN